jgi:hypothetical protein
LYPNPNIKTNLHNRTSLELPSDIRIAEKEITRFECVAEEPCNEDGGTETRDTFSPVMGEELGDWEGGFDAQGYEAEDRGVGWGGA